MARYIGIGGDQPKERSERLVAAALKTLPNEWVVIHHVVWQAKRAGKEGDGEADFVLIHPRKGIVIVEVKGGGIDIRDGRWETTDRYGRTFEISPYEQALASKHALVRWLKSAKLNRKARIGHVVAFPDVDTIEHLGPAATAEITWHKLDLQNITIAVERATQHWSLSANLSEPEFQSIIHFLAPTVSVRKPLAAHSSDVEKEILYLTAEQIEIFARLRASRGGLVVGGAGTGKTILAIARAEQLARDGFRTLFVCFNELLGKSLETRFASHPKISACNYHSMCLREIRRAKLRIPDRLDTEWWESQASVLFNEAVAVTNVSFDAIVIDECQDFRPEWILSLNSLLKDCENAPMFFFADQRQELWKRDWEAFRQWSFSLNLQDNMRNTLPIATKVWAVFKDSSARKGADGPEPRWIEPKDPSRPVAEVISVVEDLLSEGFDPKRIVILCSTRNLVDRLRQHSVGPTSFGSWGGHGVAVETIRRFKGLEGEAVVVVFDSDEKFGEVEPYVAFSRARTFLTVIGSVNHRVAVNW